MGGDSVLQLLNVIAQVLVLRRVRFEHQLHVRVLVDWLAEARLLTKGEVGACSARAVHTP